MKSPVRTYATSATPYLRAQVASAAEHFTLAYKEDASVSTVDLGAGLCRNVDYIRRRYSDTIGRNVNIFDAHPVRDEVNKVDLSKVYCCADLGLNEGSAGLVLCQYVLMFLTPTASKRLARVVHELTAHNGVFICELYNNQRADIYYEGTQKNVTRYLSRKCWEVLHERKDHFTMVKGK